jgi:anaerobic ribonucleoside-triphosphate reductase activating protein
MAMSVRKTAVPRLRVGARVALTRAEGPGPRYALWVQGCAIRCPGCCNPHLFEAAGGEALPVPMLLAEVEAARTRSAIEGVTLLGGEPFEQAAALARFARGVRAMDLSVLAFSGYTLEELRSRAAGEPAVAGLLAALDVLVDGPYQAALPERERLWVGSADQRFHYFTDRYSAEIERPRDGEPLRSVEVRLSPEGRLSANGWPLAALRRLGK